MAKKTYASKKEKDLVSDRPGTLRASQLITTYGPGAMIDLLHEAVVLRGLKGWRYNELGAAKIIAPELQRRLEPDLKKLYEDQGLTVELESPCFRRPPAGDDDNPSTHQGIGVTTFPKWFVCQTCRSLLRVNDLSPPKKTEASYRHDGCGRAKPVRFVAACANGHLAEFPWKIFARHNEGCTRPRLRLVEGSSGDLSEVEVKCKNCNGRRSLAEAKVGEVIGGCQGEMPWIRFDAKVECSEQLRLLVRTASNAFFPQVVSALRIEEKKRPPVFAILERFAGDLKKVDSQAKLAMARDFNEGFANAVQKYSNDALWEGLQALRAAATSADDNKPPRVIEWERLVDAKPEGAAGVAHDRHRDFVAERARDVTLPPCIEAVVLAHKLREIRALVGFTRFESQDTDFDGEYTLGVQTAPLATHLTWLPAVDVIGEGFLLLFNEDKIAAWEASQAVQDREAILRAGFEAEKLKNKRLAALNFPGVRFYLLHSLAHMLITAVSLEAGYSASAIRERIYCSKPGHTPKMAGIMLSTGTTGSEGTLGGLVERGREVLEHLRRAWDQSQLCSNDPVCAQHNPEGDYAERYLEGAACHGCLYIAECSCERFNRYLDRALVVPTIGQPPELALFAERP